MSAEAWLIGEKKRLEFWIDLAFRAASSGDAHGARKALTNARWGVPIPESP
jgi:hypothetical protein